MESQNQDSGPTLYSTREEWKDVKPIEQSDLQNPLVPIFYPPEYKDATDYFRGIVATGERSERVLQLTEHIIRMNPAHYSVWQYRYDTLMALKVPLETEIKLMDELALTHMKHYQVWHHRKLLQIQLKKPLPELTFVAQVLALDTKNYHTWAYRQWLLTHFDEDKLWQFELSSMELMLKEDLRNNSAWHHRFFVVFDSGVRTGDEDREAVLKRELNFTKDKIALAPNNLSAWNYLRGILEKNGKKFASLKQFVLPYTVARKTTASGEGEGETESGRASVSTDDYEETYDLDNPPPSTTASLPCALAIEFLADIYIEEGDHDQAIKCFTSLAEEHDTMRRKYWNHRIKETVTAKTTS